MAKKSLPYILLLSSLWLLSCGKDDPEKIARKDREKILEYIAEHNLDAQEHESGLFYVMEQEGSGAHPTATSTVSIKYEGYLLNGKVFDFRFTPVSIYLGNTIQGWRIGIPLFKRGSKGMLLIPSGLGYGPYAQPDIPPNSVLIFEIELIDFS